jgi:hypothetical protein
MAHGLACRTTSAVRLCSNNACDPEGAVVFNGGSASVVALIVIDVL